MDWSKCIIYGTADGELKCPATQQDSKGSEAYEEFMTNVQGFKELKSLPASICFDDDVTANDLNVNFAKWHKNCHLLFSNSKLLRAQERNERKRNVEHSGDGSSAGQRKSRRGSLPDEFKSGNVINMCIFCKKSDDVLHSCETLELDKTLREQAEAMQDTDLLATIAGGDLVAIEAKYHKQCMDAFRVRYRSYTRSQATLSDSTDLSMTDSRVFAEIISFIEMNVADGEYVFSLADLHKTRLADLGHEKQVNKTRLKNKLLGHYQDYCEEQSLGTGKQTVLVFKEGLQKLLTEELESYDFDKDALSMVHVTKLIRQEMSNKQFHTFDGSFTPHCQDDSVPNSLKVLISMLLYGSNINEQTAGDSQTCLTICQLIRFNVKEKPKVVEKPRHQKTKERTSPKDQRATASLVHRFVCPHSNPEQENVESSS